MHKYNELAGVYCEHAKKLASNAQESEELQEKLSLQLTDFVAKTEEDVNHAMSYIQDAALSISPLLGLMAATVTSK